jgi:hypothetical protein
MRRMQTESVLKGIYLGLLLFAAIHESNWQELVRVVLLTLAGLAIAGLLAGWRKLSEGYSARGRLAAFAFFVLLESPELVYGGILIGMTVGAISLRQTDGSSWSLGVLAATGAVLGVLWRLLRRVRNSWTRIGLGLGLAALISAGVLLWSGMFGELGERLGLTNPVRNPTIFAVQLLLGIPLFYVLVFAGREDESEAEIGAMSALLGLGIAMLAPQSSSIQTTGFIIALMIYFWYALQVLPGLRVFKWVVRGLSYESIARHRQAILSFQSALRLDPRNKLARQGLWSVHRSLDLGQLAGDAETLSVLDVDMCLERAGALLVEAGPDSARLQEARRLLELVLSQRPALRAVVHYWRAVANTHERQFNEAAAELEQVLDPSTYLPDDRCRKAILLPAWQLAVRLHPELARRVGTPQLAIPGRRMEAIAAVERHLAEHNEDADVWGFKRVLYQDLVEAEYDAAAGPDGQAPEFDHGYAHQVGLALIGDPERWQRGCEFLRVAARGLPAHGPSIFCAIAQAYQKHGEGQKAWDGFEQAQRAGRAVGAKNLANDERQAYFAAVKILGDAALAHNRLDLAVENYQLYAEYERAGLETLRTLADLHERRGDPLAALRVTEQALLYNARDKDFLARKDRYYYSVLPADLRARLESIRGGFDVPYCIKKARVLLDAKNWDLETLDWAQHLAELALVVQPANVLAKVQVARARLRRGEKEEAVTILEELRGAKPESFASGEDEEGWYLACKLLGELYLYDLARPDLALECFQAYRQSAKSGADTVYKMGQAYEQLGDRSRAAKFYKHVVAFEGHPLAPDAHEALHRLEAK